MPSQNFGFGDPFTGVAGNNHLNISSVGVNGKGNTFHGECTGLFHQCQLISTCHAGSEYANAFLDGNSGYDFANPIGTNLAWDLDL